ncbi:MAG: class I SAM-dependent methyltransferase [Chloroflexi bacterium]|nr:class I SAM-dependent methyltransferase [Chloroflexota bacterium]
MKSEKQLLYAALSLLVLNLVLFNLILFFVFNASKPGGSGYNGKSAVEITGGEQPSPPVHVKSPAPGAVVQVQKGLTYEDYARYGEAALLEYLQTGDKQYLEKARGDFQASEYLANEAGFSNVPWHSAYCDYLGGVPVEKLKAQYGENCQVLDIFKNKEDAVKYLVRMQAYYCAMNISTLKDALYKYKNDRGKFPGRLEDLVPGCLPRLPVCYKAGKDTYSGTYRKKGQSFNLYCKGGYHADAGLSKNTPTLTGNKEKPEPGDVMDPVTTLLLNGRNDPDRPERVEFPLVAKALKIKQGSKVADIGCGIGAFSFYLAPVVGDAGKVYAIDIEPYAIKYIGKIKKEKNLKSLSPVLSRPLDIGIPKSSIDSAFMWEVYHCMCSSRALEQDENYYQKELKPWLGSMYRALKPGGLIAVIDTDRAGEGTGEVSLEAVKRHMEKTGFKFKEVFPVQEGTLYCAVFERP